MDNNNFFNKNILQIKSCYPQYNLDDKISQPTTKNKNNNSKNIKYSMSSQLDDSPLYLQNNSFDANSATQSMSNSPKVSQQTQQNNFSQNTLTMPNIFQSLIGLLDNKLTTNIMSTIQDNPLFALLQNSKSNENSQNNNGVLAQNSVDILSKILTNNLSNKTKVENKTKIDSFKKVDE